MQWERLLSEFGKEAVRLAGADDSWLPVAYNPITRALRERPATSQTRVGKRTTDVQGGYLGDLWNIKGFSMTALSRAATICQMSVYDDRGGPDGDGEPKGLRRSWYAWYKVDFAQPFSRQLGEPTFNGIGWSGRMSQTYSYLVDNKGATYQHLWVKDSSRMMREFYTPLYRNANFVFCVEKDSLFEDFEAAAAAMGCRVLLSGKGKMSKAGTEKMLRQYFYYNGRELFDEDNPLVLIALTDHDFDGQAVIDPTFAA